jgi:hypothetical protein
MGGKRDQYSSPPTEVFQSWGPDEENRLDRILAVSPNAPLTVNQDARFVIKTPHVRCNLRLAVFVARLATDADPIGSIGNYLDFDSGTGYVFGLNALWICSRAHYRGGGALVPTKDVVGTRDAPLIIPTNKGLYGFEVELQTSGEELFGILTMPFQNTDTIPLVQNPTIGKDWHVACRYSSTVPLTAEEYARARAAAEITIPTGEGRKLK